jgi:serine protease Do
VTVGVLSAKNREARYDGQVLYRDILQTDAAVNPGNSGGPLINLDGELIGINVAIYQDAQNIGFAMPVKRARTLLTRWLTPRLIHNRWPGFDLDAPLGASIVVRGIDPASDAYAQGLRDGDRLETVNDQPADSLFEVNQRLLPLEVGSEVRFGFRLGETLRTFTLPITAVPKPSGERLADSLLGVVFDCSEKAAQVTGKYRSCLIVKEIDPGSPAALANLRPGMMVSAINDKELQTIDDVGLALERVSRGDPVRIDVMSIVEHDTFMLAQTTTLNVIAR